MNRLFELPLDIATRLWNAVTSQTAVLEPDLALAIRKALQASTAAPVVVPAPTPPWVEGSGVATALRGLGGASSFVPGAEGENVHGANAGLPNAVIAAAQGYQPDAVTEADLGNPLAWAWRNFKAAGMVPSNSQVPNGPMDRWAGKGARANQPGTWAPALKAVIANYKADSDKIQSSDDHSEADAAWAAGNAHVQQEAATPAPPGIIGVGAGAAP